MIAVDFLGALFAQAAPVAEKAPENFREWFYDLPKAVSFLAVVLVVFVLPFFLGWFIAKKIRMPAYAWKIGLILCALTAAKVTVFLGWPPHLGVDLKGGYIMIWQIDRERQAEQQDVPGKAKGPRSTLQSGDQAALISALKNRLNPDGLKEISIRPYGANEVEIIIPETNEAQIRKIKQQILAAGVLEFLILAERGTDAALFETASQQSQNVATRRLRFVKEGDRKIGKWAKVGRDPEKQGVRELRVSGGWSNYLLRNSATGELIDGNRLPSNGIAAARFLDREKIEDIDILMKYTESARVTGADLAQTAMQFDENGFPSVSFSLKTAAPTAPTDPNEPPIVGSGAVRMGSLTSANIGRALAITLDDRLLSYANIRSQITSSGQITGRFTEEEVEDIIKILRAGSLPASLDPTPVYEDLSDPTLGAENIRQGAIAIGVSLLFVFVFTLFYYRFAGAVACFALAANILMTLAVMILFGATFTMPGLAGMVLTVGMSVDANVLIFERMREEIQKGASVRMAIRNGFDRAMSTIIDSNLTTLLTAIVLYLIGTDQLVGFAVTLTLGILISMFTAIFCSRVIFEVTERTGFLKQINMMHFMTKTNIDFVRYQWVCIAASSILIGIGLAAAMYRGAGIFDIDLRGGTSIQMALNRPMDEQEVRSILDKTFSNESYNGSRVDYTLKTVGGTDDSGKRSSYRVDTIFPDADYVQGLIVKNFVDENGKGLLKYYDASFKPVAASTKQGAALPGDESTFFTALNQDELKKEEAAKEPAAEAKAEDKPAEKQEEPAAKEKGAEKKEASPETKAEEPAKKSDVEEEKKDEEKPVAAKTDDGGDFDDQSKKAEAKPIDGASAEAAPTVTTEVRFSDNTGKSEGIDAAALRTRLETAAKELGIETLQIDVDHPDWDRSPETRRDTWNVGLSTSAADAQRILEQMTATLKSSPVWPSSKKIGGQIAGDFIRIAIGALVASLIGIVLYIWVRFQNVQWGFAAVLALVHDVLFMLAGIAVSYWFAGSLGILGITEFKIDLTVIAAFLTLIGYSINDTIVVFDRMREVKGKMPRLTKQMVNDSINQTLSRTFLTFFTTFMVVAVLYAVGGQGIHAFAFAMLIGTVVGVYSSIYIAAPFLLWMVEGDEAVK